jgi:hypothetical protein
VVGERLEQVPQRCIPADAPVFQVDLGGRGPDLRVARIMGVSAGPLTGGRITSVSTPSAAPNRGASGPGGVVVDTAPLLVVHVTDEVMSKVDASSKRVTYVPVVPSRVACIAEPALVASMVSGPRVSGATRGVNATNVPPGKG